MIKLYKLLCTALFLSSLLFSMQARAASYDFNAITANGHYTNLGEQYLSVEIMDAGSNNVSFLFENTAPAGETMSITDIYFSNTPTYFSSLVSIDNSDPGVSFSQYARPGSLPAGGGWNWGLSADSNSPKITASGINAGESLTILLALAGGTSFSDLMNGISNNDFAVGIHVQAFSDGSSESYVTATPIPAAIWLMGSGLVGVLVLSRKNKAQAIAGQTHLNS